jgi:DNA repair exonuclease SbcCD nuclease subunit
MIRLLHLADAHLDTAFEGRTEALRKRLRASLRAAFERAVDHAVEAPVDVVVIAGDLFDDDRLSFATEAFLVTQCGRLDEAGIPVIYATGNHDPGGPGYRASQIDWPDTFIYVDAPEPETIELTNPDGSVAAYVTAAGHASTREETNLAATFPPRSDPDTPHIGVLHAHVTSAARVDAHDRYAPCSPDDLAATGYDYWALGHIHQQQPVNEDRSAWYSGNLQGRSPRETGEKGALLVEVSAGQPPTVRPLPLADTRWETVTLTNLAEVATLRDLEDVARSALVEHLQAGNGRTPALRDVIVRFALDGPSPLAGELDDPDAVDELEAVLTDHLGVLDADVRTRRLVPPVDVEAFRGETHLAGEVLALLRRAAEDDEVLASVAPDAWASLNSDAGAAADEEQETADRAAVRELLQGLDHEAIARLVRQYAE